MDLFPEELSQSQAEEIKRLQAKVDGLENTCRWLNMIYRSAWDISAVVAGEGELLLTTESVAFCQLYDRMGAYDDSQDLRDKFKTIEKD